MASTSPSDTTSPANSLPATGQDIDNLERKRARDRKSQKAMRERTKWNIQILTQKVENLTQALELAKSEKDDLYNRFLAISEENDHLRVQKSALQLKLLGNGQSSPSNAPSSTIFGTYEAVPLNIAPTCLSDQILQTFIESHREVYTLQTAGRIKSYPNKPDLTALFDGRPNRCVDETSAVVGDIVRSYTEIDTLPKQVAVHYIMSTLLRWQVLRTKTSFDAMPEWLRPEQAQLEKPHACWIDRIPWPKVRTYLINHPEVEFDDFASAYSSSFDIKWNYDPSHVIITTTNDDQGGIVINPVYEEHLKRLDNWTVRGVFRRKFPEMTEFVDSYAKPENYSSIFPENVLNPMKLPKYAI